MLETVVIVVHLLGAIGVVGLVLLQQGLARAAEQQMVAHTRQDDRR